MRKEKFVGKIWIPNVEQTCPMYNQNWILKNFIIWIILSMNWNSAKQIFSHKK